METKPAYPGTYDCNPMGLRAGDECYAVYVPAFRPGHEQLDGVHDAIVHGTVASSYNDNPVGGTDEPENLVPDEPFPGTDLMAAIYGLPFWAVFPDLQSAKDFRAALIGRAVAVHEDAAHRLRERL